MSPFDQKLVIPGSRFPRAVAYAAVIVAAVIVALWLGLMWLARLDVKSANFPDYAALVQSESWQKGWMPVFIPKVATDIYEEHDLDTNAVYGEFSAPSFSPELVGLRKLTDAEKSRLIDTMPWGSLRRRIGNEPVFAWCDQTEKMSVHLIVGPGGRATYWGRGGSC